MNRVVKTRFAPSPTGYLHVGGLRTALYSYLFAKKHKGIFLLRIEDTDQNRYVEGAVEKLIESLQFFDMNWDQGPYFQSKRTDIYKKHLETLLESGKAYKCFCTSERLEQMRLDQQASKQSPKYDRKCYNLTEQEKANLYSKGTPFVVRQFIENEEIVFNDLVRGEVSFHGKDIDDQVLLKSDGFPTYHLANVVDDYEMEITHVIRGEEWLPSTPKHVLLYKAFGWQAPDFAHLPLLLNSDKSKLSKRQGDVAVEDYIKKGYLKESMLNFIAFLGWNPGTTQEFFSTEELIHAFELNRVQKAGAVFSLEKLDWFNAHYIRKKTAQELSELILPDLRSTDWFKTTKYRNIELSDLNKDESTEANDFLKYISCVQTRMKTLLDAKSMLKPFLLDSLDYNLDLFENQKMKIDKATSILALENAIPALEQLEDYSNEESIKTILTDLIKNLGLKNGQVLWPIRVALSNEEFSPGAFELIMIMGKQNTVQKIKNAVAQLNASI